MIYDVLARYYDALVGDEQATESWSRFIEQHVPGKELLELACGSGEITIALAKQGYHIDASDLSEAMIEEALRKGQNDIHFFVMDMNTFTVEKQYDGILCLCDSINYLVEESQIQALFKQVYKHLRQDGVWLFDTHSMDRLEEFQDEFYEEGIVEGKQYAWSILADDPYLYHNFIFYDEDANAQMEQHIQRVYDPKALNRYLEPYFNVEIYTDFTLSGIQPGEKYFYVCRRK